MQFETENSQTLFLFSSLLTWAIHGQCRSRSDQEEKNKKFHRALVICQCQLVNSLVTWRALIIYPCHWASCCQGPSVDVYSSSVESECQVAISEVTFAAVFANLYVWSWSMLISCDGWAYCGGENQPGKLFWCEWPLNAVVQTNTKLYFVLGSCQSKLWKSSCSLK